MTDDKKISAICDILEKNNKKENDCSNVCYIGDGYSDADAMRFVHNNGGKAILVHQPNKDDFYYNHNKAIYETLNATGIIDFYCVANYNIGSKLSDILLRKKGMF